MSFEEKAPSLMTRIFAYPAKEIRKEYIRAGFGVTITLVPLLLFGPSSVIVYILAGFLMLFAAYGIRAVYRSGQQIILGQEGISVSGLKGKHINWEELETFKLSYFSTRRDGENGWMQLKLKGKGDGLTFESTITDFEDLVLHCTKEALRRRLSFDPASIRNLSVLGVSSEDIARYRDGETSN
jgi:hypothetical protein